jgi:hypothetical protein
LANSGFGGMSSAGASRSMELSLKFQF